MFGQNNRQERERQVSRSRKKGLFTSMHINKQYNIQSSKPNIAKQEIFPNVAPYLENTMGINQFHRPKVNQEQQQQNNNETNFFKQASNLNEPSQSYFLHPKIKYQPINRGLPSFFVKQQNEQKRQYQSPSFVVQKPLSDLPHFLDGNIHEVIEGNIKKTYIPHHIYNDIPVYDNPNINIKETNQPEENYETVLNHYRKLYQSYNEQKNINDNLKRNIVQLQYRLRNKQKQPNLRQTINKKQLSKLIQQRYQNKIDEVINRRKTNALNRVRDLFSNQGLIITQEIRTQSYSYR